jgi:hypothetical protein
MQNKTGINTMDDFISRSEDGTLNVQMTGDWLAGKLPLSAQPIIINP